MMVWIRYYQYTGIGPNAVEGRDEEKYFKVGKRTSEVIDTYLVQGKNILMLRKVGAGKDA